MSETETLREAARSMRQDAQAMSNADHATFHAIADLLDHQAEASGYFQLAKFNCSENDEANGCGCSYKDCYEHGKWHDCTHGTPDLTDALNVARTYLGRP